jgi:hypothetical protein
MNKKINEFKTFFIKGMSKKINFLGLGLLFVGASLLNSCSKENKINKNLWKNGGEWNIVTLVSKQTSSNPINTFNESFSNVGTFKFNENGSGSVSVTLDGETQSETFTYMNTEDKLTLVINNESRIFNLVWEKNEMEMTIVESYNSLGDSNVYTEIYTLKKK